MSCALSMRHCFKCYKFNVPTTTKHRKSSSVERCILKISKTNQQKKTKTWILSLVWMIVTWPKRAFIWSYFNQKELSKRFQTSHVDLFSGGSRIFPRGCANSQNCYYFSNFLPKIAWKWKNLDSQGGARPWRSPPLLRSANAFWHALQGALSHDKSQKTNSLPLLNPSQLLTLWSFYRNWVTMLIRFCGFLK